jgi:D-beta-D-heptose 7-phosphate kinase/D-beta-D-heptose 1-phosphate adenosyltransferase
MPDDLARLAILMFLTPTSKLKRLVGRLRGRRIGVVGDFMLDRYVLGEATRLSPEAAVPVVDFVSETDCLGGAGNVAANLAALGARVTPFGVTGDDEAGRGLRASLAEKGMSDKGVLTDPRRLTTMKTRIIARHQQVVRVDREEKRPLPPALEQSLIARIKGGLSKLDALVVSDYDKGVITDALADRVLDECRRLGLPALVKPKTSRLFAYRGATAIVCNKKEAGFFVTRELSDEKSIEEAGRALLAHFGCAAIVITLGKKGMSLFEEAKPRHVYVPATSFEVSYARVGLPGVDGDATGRQVFDVTGAGDTVLAVLALAVAARAPLEEAVALANLAAGVVVGKLGTATVAPAELMRAIQERR